MPRKKSFLKGNKFVAISLIVLALACVGWGLQSSHEVFAQKSQIDSGGVFLTMFQEISEIELTEDSTFSGVESYKGKLLSTYDRSQPKTKQACPT